MEVRLTRLTSQPPTATLHNTTLEVGSWTSEVLACPSSSRDRFEADAAADRRRNDSEFRHQAIELRGKHRLCAVAQRAIRIVVHLDEQAVAPCRDGRPRQLRHHVASSGAMTRIRHDGQMTELLH